MLSGSRHRATRPSPLRVAVLATLVLCLGYAPASRTPAVQQLEAQLLDLRFRLRPQAPPSDDIVLVPIDDASIREVGRWPWTRAILADGLARLAAAGARTIAIDVLFAEPEPEALPGALRDRLRQALAELEARGIEGIDPEQIVTRLGDELPGDSTLAAETAAAGNVVLPYSFGFGALPAADPPEPPAAIATTAFRIVRNPDPGRTSLPLVAISLLAPLPEVAQAAASLGHGNVRLDQDGTARFEFPAVAYGQKVYPSFALEVARHQLAVPRDQIRLEIGRGVWLRDRLVPTDDRTRLVVNYRPPGRFRAMSFARVLAGDFAPAQFKGKVVLIGGSAAGVGDTFGTPFTGVMPGIERHATVVDGILRQDFIVRSNETLLLDLGSIVLGGLVIGALGRRPGLLAPSLGFGALVATVLALNLLAFFEFGYWLDLFAPLLALLVLYAVVVLYKYFIGERQERRIRAAFKHYLSPALVEQVAGDPSLLQLGGEQKELTVLFADLRNSTQIGARLPPAEFVQLLNDAMDTMTAVLFAHDGMLDKYTGDGLVAVFGAPMPQPDHALRACRAALAMLDELRAVQARWARPDLPPVEIGVGINTGSMIIGNMGSKERFSYTVIGDEANLGARLEAANKEFQTHILISEATWQRVKEEIAAREIDVVTFRGMARPVRVYEVLGTYPLAGDDAQRLEAFAAGLAAWRRQRWAEAKTAFERVLAITPDDGPSQLYLERCRTRLIEGSKAAASP